MVNWHLTALWNSWAHPLAFGSSYVLLGRFPWLISCFDHTLFPAEPNLEKTFLLQGGLAHTFPTSGSDRHETCPLPPPFPHQPHWASCTSFPAPNLDEWSLFICVKVGGVKENYLTFANKAKRCLNIFSVACQCSASPSMGWNTRESQYPFRTSVRSTLFSS